MHFKEITIKNRVLFDYLIETKNILINEKT